MLSLLLELSDQPTFKSRLEHLDALRPAEQLPSEPLRWEDIAAEDGWAHDADLWKTASYSYSDDSADDDDDGHGDDGADSAAESDATTLPGEVPRAGRLARDLIIRPEDPSALAAVQEAQAWRRRPPPPDATRKARKVAVPEPQVVRDVLFMLQGLDSTIFGGKDGQPSADFQLLNLAWETYRSSIGAFADYGRRLGVLRDFAARPQRVPHLQALQDCISRRLDGLDAALSRMQSHLAAPEGEIVASLMAIRGELLPRLEPLFALSGILSQVQHDSSRADTFGHLELMFDETNLAQLTGRTDTYHFLASVFIECFNVYIRPIRQWMDEGKLLPGNELFFITEPASDVSMRDTWQGRFELRTAADGSLDAPRFLRAAVGNMYNAGKNIVVLGLLGRQGSAAARGVPAEEPPLDYAAICPPGLELAPFSDLFGAAFERWIQSKYRKTSETLKKALVDDWRLPYWLDSLRALYLMSDGSAAASFCESLFGGMDAGAADWSDRYGLTAAASEAFASHVDINRLSVSVDAAGQPPWTAEQARDSVQTALPRVKISYKLPWPVQMIVTRESMGHYQSLFTLLLQIKRALHALHRPGVAGRHGQRRGEHALFYSARNKLLWFCNTLLSYLATLVLEPLSREMRRRLDAADDVDAMIAAHARATKQMVDEACLGSRLGPLRQGMLDVLDLALRLEQGREAGAAAAARYGDVLRGIEADLERHVRFVASGLRSVARASSHALSAKWDTLADMLQAGERGRAF